MTNYAYAFGKPKQCTVQMRDQIRMSIEFFDNCLFNPNTCKNLAHHGEQQYHMLES